MTHSPSERAAWFRAGSQRCDVAVIGAGAIGATVYRRLGEAGYRVVMVDRGDVGGGASQGSANLIWGGLLYLSRGRLDEVVRWCAERDGLTANRASGVTRLPCLYRIAPSRRSPLLVHAALLGYWMLGRCRGMLPWRSQGHIHFAEARLDLPDARWSWRQVAMTPPGCVAATWSAIESISRCPGGWTMVLNDRRSRGSMRLEAALVVNAGGAWAGKIDAQAGIDHGWDIVPSRGVSLVVAGVRPTALMIEHPRERDVLSLVPFPGADACIWGSTETLVTDPDAALAPSQAEVSELVRLHRQLVGPLSRAQVLAVRCGVRALAVRRGAAVKRSQDLTRSFRILDREPGWITILGGKLTGAEAAARHVLGQARRGLGGRPPPASFSLPVAPTIHFPGLDQPLPDPGWCREHEQCWTLDSWLRRRTPVAQLVAGGGLGLQDQHHEQVQHIAAAIHGSDGAEALADYRARLADLDLTLRKACAEPC